MADPSVPPNLRLAVVEACYAEEGEPPMEIAAAVCAVIESYLEQVGWWTPEQLWALGMNMTIGEPVFRWRPEPEEHTDV